MFRYYFGVIAASLARKLMFHERRHAEEPKKAVIHTSFWKAFLLCRVHVIPASVSITVLILTFNNYYIGTKFAGVIEYETINLLLLQVAAKAQELAIAASLATIIFDVARTELLFGDGLPLGLIGSGLLVGNLGYFFSPEFMGSFGYTGNLWRKARLMTLLILAGLTVALSGPATAVLIVPRKQDISKGGTSYYIKGENRDIWPITLDATAAGNSSHCSGPDGIRYAICPCAGFQSLWSHFGETDFSNFRTASTSSIFSKPLSGTMFFWKIASPLSLFPRVYTLGNPRQTRVMDHTFLVQPHAASATLLERMTEDWWKTLLWKTNREQDSIDDREAKSTMQNAKTSVKCSPPQNISSTSNSVQFFIMDRPAGWGPLANFSVESLSRNASDHLRFQWVHLPGTFGFSSVGALFESPWTADNSSRVAIGCSVHAQWYNATLYSNKYNYWTGWYPWNIRFHTGYPRQVDPTPGKASSPTNGRIAVTDEWLDLLTPPTPGGVPGYFPWKPSTIESILMNAGFAQSLVPEPGLTMTEDWEKGDSSGIYRTNLLETVICSVFEDGVSRAGSHLLYKDTESPDPSQWQLYAYIPKPDFNSAILSGGDAFQQPDEPYATLEVAFQISGYAFRPSLAGYLSMTVLFVHLLFALIHSIHLLARRKSSDSWDSISKLISLAQNSHPAHKILSNTGAGIDKWRTYSRTAKVRATESSEGSGIHLELMFQDESGDTTVTGDFVEDMEQNGRGRYSMMELQVPDGRPHGHSRGTSAASVQTTTSTGMMSVMTKNSMSSLLGPVGFRSFNQGGYVVSEDLKYG